MSTFYVRKNGSGTHTDITSAYMAASAGDTIDIGAGTFTESIEVLKQNITFTGAGKDQTIIQGNYVAGAASQAEGCSWTSGNDFFTYTTQIATTGHVPFAVGMSIGDTSASLIAPGGFPAASQVTSIDVANKKVYINKTFTATQTAKKARHYGVQATFEVRASGFSMSNLKVIDMSGSVVSGAVEYSAIFLGSRTSTPALSKYSSSHASGFNINNCEIVADGDSAILGEANVGVGNGTVDSCIISGKTFTGQYSPGTGNAVKNAVFFSNANLPVTFTNNKLDVICGGMTNAATPIYGGNQIATIDAYGSVVTGNQFKGKAVNPSGAYFNMTGLALRMRNGSATVSSNVIKGSGGLPTGGYLILPSYANLAGKTIPVGEVITFSSRYFKCTVEHLYATDKHPVTGTLASSHWSELTGDIAALLIANGKANYQANSGTNITITKGLVASAQASSGQKIVSEMSKELVSALSSVSSDADFSSISSWSMVSYVFKHTSSSKRLVSSFKSFDGFKSTALKSGMASGQKFELHKIIVKNASGVLKVVKRAEIEDASSFDITLK
jgi:hypothetical protein